LFRKRRPGGENSYSARIRLYEILKEQFGYYYVLNTENVSLRWMIKMRNFKRSITLLSIIVMIIFLYVACTSKAINTENNIVKVRSDSPIYNPTSALYEKANLVVEGKILKLRNAFYPAKDIHKKGSKIEFDTKVKTDSNTIIIEPSKKITKVSSEFMEQARQWKEESQKPVTGLFDTELDIKQEGSEVKLVFFLCNISEKILRLDFDVGREFDFFVENTEGKEVYRWSYGKEIYLPAITQNKLKKDEKLSFSGVWDYKDNNDSRVEPGKYSITIKLFPRVDGKKNISSDELTAIKDIVIN